MSRAQPYQRKHPLWSTAGTTVHAGVRQADQQPVIIKCVSDDATAPGKTLSELRHDYQLASNLLGLHHLPPLEQDRIDGHPVFIYEDIPHRPLAQSGHNGEPWDVANLLQLAIELTRALNTLHARHIVHRNVCAHSVLWDPASRTVRLTDFGLACSATDWDNIAPPCRDAGDSSADPAYTSPEMTGRIDQPMDQRSDLYSLGTLLYERSTATLPFPGTDLLDVVHGHLAIVPPAPATLNPQLPPALSEIIMKLLEKMADNRYQSGHSLLADLEHCQREYQATGSIRPFPLSATEPHGQFRISDRIYGRTREIDTLLQAWQRTGEQCGQTVFILGAAGTGKTRLSEELQHRVALQGGLFISGKFEQQEADEPYQGFVRVLESLSRQLLSLDEDTLQQWCDRLQQAVAPNGGILTGLLPQLEQVLGPQVEIAVPSVTESRNRFNRVLLEFFTAIADAEHPAVVHLDDLHWADPGSLELLKQLATNRNRHHLLLICSYRHNEVDALHPVTVLREAMASDETPWTDIRLNNLPADDIVQLLRDSLELPAPTTPLDIPSHLRRLTDTIIGSTLGNPLFARQLLQQLYDDALIRWTDGHWQYTEPSASALTYPDDIMALLREKLDALPEQARDLLRIAACLGNRFLSRDLAAIAEIGEAELATALEPAIHAGLVMPLERRYQFAHDRMQQAAAASIPEPSRAALYLHIARRLGAILSPEEHRERLFEITNLWNAVGNELTDHDLLHVIELNQAAALKANAANAYHTALDYAKHATRLLRRQSWENHRARTFECYFELARNHYLSGDIEPALTQARDLLQRSIDLKESGRCYALIKDIITNQGDDYPLAVQLGREVLNKAGIAIAAGPNLPRAVSRARRRIEDQLQHGQRDAAERLSELPRANHGDHKRLLRLLMDLWEAAYYQGDTALMELCALHMVEQSLQHGNASESAFGYALYAMHLALAGQHDRAYQVGAFALRLNDDFSDRILLPKITNLFCNYTACFRQAFADITRHYEHSARIARENGDYLFGVWATFFMVWTKLLAGHPLPEIHQLTLAHQAFVDQTHDAKMQRAYRMLQLGVLHLMGEQDDGEFLTCAGSELADTLAFWRAEQFIPGQGWYAILAGQINTLLGYAPQALEGYTRYGRDNDPAIVMFPATQHGFYQCLAELADIAQANADERQRRLRHAARVIDELAPLARDCPDNFAHQYRLLQAETARIEDRPEQAAQYFGKALEAVEGGSNLCAAALTNELTATFWRQQGNAGFAHQFTQRAFHLYRQWGANPKAQQMARWLGKDRDQPSPAPSTGRPPQRLDVSAMDLAAILRSTQAISEETDIHRVLERIVQICTEQTGAQRGVLVTASNDELNVECVVESAPEQRADTRVTPLDQSHDACHRIVRYSVRSGETVLLGNAGREGDYRNDPYIKQRQVKSVMCVPFFRSQRLIGAIYLENNLASNVFTGQRLEILHILLGQAAISLENARIHSSLRQSEQRMRQSQRYANIGTWEWNIETGELYWSENIAPMFGLDEEISITGIDTFSDAVHPDDRERVSQAVQHSLDHGTPYDIEHRIVWPDGSVHWVNEVAEVVRNANGTPQQMIGVVRDITDAVTARELQQQTQRQLQQAQKMEAVGQLTGGIAHDFNNMLASIVGYSDLLKAENDRHPNENISRYLQAIVTAGNRATNLVRQLLAFSRNESGKVSLIELTPLATETLKLARSTIPANIELRANFDQHVGPVLADPVQVQQVLMNLCINARDAIEQPGEITLSLNQAKLNGSTCASCLEPVNGEFVRVSVTNSGAPIRPEVAKRMFDPFFTTKEVGKGSGMGLAMCHGIMHACGGHITLDTDDRRGTTFSLLFPPCNDPAVAEPAALPTGPAQTAVRARIMVVDDERSIVTLLTETLEASGCSVSAFFDSDEALRRFEQGPDDFDLVITDQNMPKLTGMMLAERMLAQRPELPIVLSSGYSADVTEDTALNAGITAYLEKPYRPRQLVELISRLLA